MFINGHTILNTLRGAAECLVIGSLGQTGEYQCHAAVHLRDFLFTVALDDAHIRGKHHGLFGNPDIFKKYLALVQRTLPDFIQRLTAGDPREIQPNNRQALPLHSLGRIQSNMKYRVGGNGAITNPGGLLAVNNVLIAFKHTFNLRTDGRVGNISHIVRTVIRLRNCPTPYKFAFGVLGIGTC